MSCDLLVPSSLGFTKAKCCKTPCPNLPPVRVNICVQVNQISKIIIQQGCYLGESVQDAADLHPCKVDWKTGFAATSWGDKFRRVTYSYWVPYKTFIRIRVCANTDTGCDSGGCPVPNDALGAPIENKIVRFEVNGVDVVEQLNIVDIPVGFKNCVFIGCQDAQRGSSISYPETSTCCHDDTGSTGTAALAWSDATLALPWGAEVVVGPVGTSLGL
jgi:hypothetical protein